MKYFLDFDDTLYDARSFKRQVAEDGTGAWLFTPEIWRHYDVRKYLFADTLDWLRSKAKEDLYILTSAMTRDGKVVMEYQREKLRTSHLEELVAEVLFTSEQKGEDAAEIAKRFPPFEPVAFIDDKLEQCRSVKAALPHAHCFLMVRDQEEHVPSAHGVFVVRDLAGVDAMIEKL